MASQCPGEKAEATLYGLEMTLIPNELVHNENLSFVLHTLSAKVTLG